jgi:hypothetical protein
MTHAPVLVRVLAIFNTASEQALCRLRGLRAGEGLPFGQLDPQALVALAACRGCAVRHRAEATADWLVRAIRSAAHGHGDLPPELVRHLIDQVGEPAWNVLKTSLMPSETDVSDG